MRNSRKENFFVVLNGGCICGSFEHNDGEDEEAGREGLSSSSLLPALLIFSVLYCECCVVKTLQNSPGIKENEGV